MGIGRFTLHLEQISDIEALQGREVTVNQRFGQLRVVIPSSVAAVIDATVDHGSIDGPAHVQDIGRGRRARAAESGPRRASDCHPSSLRRVRRHPDRAGGLPLARTSESADETTLPLDEGDIYVAAACN